MMKAMSTRVSGKAAMVWMVLTGLAIAQSGYSQSVESKRLKAIPFQLMWEQTPQKVRLTPDSLVMTAGEKTDMFRDPNVTYNTDNAPKLLFKPDGDFVLTASIRHAFNEKWDGGAIVLKNDSLNWVKLCFEKDYTGAHRVVSVVTKDISDDCNSVSLPGNKIYYKVAKAGPRITLYYSTDNANWFLVRHFQMTRTENLRVGFLAQAPVGKSCTVTFADISYQAKRIEDPYTGQ